MGENKNSFGRGILHGIMEKTSLPSDIAFGGFRLEMQGGRELYVSGCKKILKYTEGEIILRASAFDVFICGKHLECLSYHPTGISICGQIKSIGLGDYL